MTLSELRAAVRQTLLELTLTSSAPSTSTDSPSRGHAESTPPRPDRSPAEAHAQRAHDAWSSPVRLEKILGQARAELAVIKRRPGPARAAVEDHEELAARVIRDGEGYVAAEVAMALRCTPTMIRKIRAAAGRDPERGRAIAPEIANGAPTDFGVGLIAAGYSSRQAALLSGVPATTLRNRAARAEA